MATGTSVSNSMYGIINDAMVDAGLLQEGQLPNSEQLAKFMRRLQDIINLWQTYGLKLWLQQEVPFAMVAGQSIYTFGPTSAYFGIAMPKPSRVLQGYIQVSASTGQQLYLTIPITFPIPQMQVGDAARLDGPGASINGIINAFFPAGLSSTTVGIQLLEQMPWSASQINANLGSYILTDTTIPAVYNVISSAFVGGGVRRPIVPLSVDEWERLGQGSSSLGPVNSYMVRKQATALQVNLWLTPDTVEALNLCVLLFQVQPTNPLQLTDSIAFPQEWRIALRWALAEDICTGQPQTIVERCMNNAKIYREALENWDVEDATTSFAPDMRMQQGYGRFK